MSFWTVEDAGPYKEKSNFLLRTCLPAVIFYSGTSAQRRRSS